MDKLFAQALNYIKNLPAQNPPGSAQITNDDKLAFYALFKQATVGPNNTKAPSKFKIVQRYKWTAWQKLGRITKQQAMKTYVQKLTKIDPDWNVKPKL